MTGCLMSLAIMTWICIKSQIALATGELIYAPKPVTTEGCTYDFEAMISMANQTVQAVESKYNLQLLYMHINF